jgi:hypothetical protein
VSQKWGPLQYRNQTDLRRARRLHAHVHIIPRWKGDAPDPRGGIRWCEIDIARDWGKPIIGIELWGQERTPIEVQASATIMVGWNTQSIVAGVQELCPLIADNHNSARIASVTEREKCLTLISPPSSQGSCMSATALPPRLIRRSWMPRFEASRLIGAAMPGTLELLLGMDNPIHGGHLFKHKSSTSAGGSLGICMWHSRGGRVCLPAAVLWQWLADKV